MKIVVIIPTYNEAETIGEVMSRLQTSFKTMLRHDFFILVVDGNSPDGTADIVKSQTEKTRTVKLIVEKEKSGLGSAYMQGFKYAMDILEADVVVEMDADLQHKPEDVVRLVAEIDNGADYVIGSRFIDGGSIPDDWSTYRKFLSNAGNIFTKYVLWIFNVNDFTSGFKAARVKGFLDKIDFNTIKSKGFAYKIDFLFRYHSLGAKIKEVPIEFGLRDRGDSKMEKSNFMQSLSVVLQLRAEKSRNFLTFLSVGIVGLMVDLFVFNLFKLLEYSELFVLQDPDFHTSMLASLIAGLVAMFTTYILNNRWTFKEKRKTSRSDHTLSIMVYYFSSYVPILFRSWLIKWVVDHLGDNFITNNLAFMVGVGFGVFWNYTIYSRFIWGTTKKEPEEKKADK